MRLLPGSAHCSSLPAVSTGSLFDLDIRTEDSVTLLARNGVKEVEVYLQCNEETTPRYIAELAARCVELGVTVSSVHPYVFGFENLLISNYTRQRTGALAHFRRLIEACAQLSAGIYVAHGPPRHLATEGGLLTDRYVRRTHELIRIASDHGVRYSLENVSYGLVCTPSEALGHVELFGDEIGFVLDFKSAWKIGYQPQDFVRALGSAIVLTHVSFRSQDSQHFGACAGPGVDEEEVAGILRDCAAISEFNSRYVVEVFGARTMEDVMHSVDVVTRALSASPQPKGAQSGIASEHAMSGPTQFYRPEDRWRRVASATGLLASDGSARATIFADMSSLATRTKAVNLGQGFPDVDGPASVAQVAMDAIAAGVNQYPPGPGTRELRDAIAQHQLEHYGIHLDAETEVLVTAGATEGIAATLLAFAGPGDEVLTLEPFYDAHAAAISLAGATHTTAPLRATPSGFHLDTSALAAAFSNRTRVVLINSPHNPTGMVLSRVELESIARLASQYDALVVTDEVYEHLTFPDASGQVPAHVPIATLPGMAERTLTISSAGKTFSFTGWKVGWVSGPAALVTAVRTVKQFLTFVNGAPFQPAVAFALREPAVWNWVGELTASLATRRDLLSDGLTAAGFDVVRPQGTYFVLADAAPLGWHDGTELCWALPEQAGVAAVPVQAFTHAGSATDEALRSWVRFTFVKRTNVLEDAVGRLQKWSGSRR